MPRATLCPTSAPLYASLFHVHKRLAATLRARTRQCANRYGESVSLTVMDRTSVKLRRPEAEVRASRTFDAAAPVPQMRYYVCRKCQRTFTKSCGVPDARMPGLGKCAACTPSATPNSPRSASGHGLGKTVSLFVAADASGTSAYIPLARAALDAARQEHFDAVILDVDIPGMTASRLPELCGLIHKRRRR